MERQRVRGREPGGCADRGPEPFVADLGLLTQDNRNYRTALWTGSHLQTTLMSIRAGEDIGLEVHPHVDQFLFIESGYGLAEMGPGQEHLTYRERVRSGYAVFIPAGTWHNVTNTGRGPLKLFSIYAPPNHPRCTVHETKEIAEEAEAHGG